MKKELLRLEQIARAEGGEIGLSNLNLTLYQGEIHGLIGLNRSGVLELIDVLTGRFPADQGRMYIAEQPVKIKSKRDAQGQGIFCIRQVSGLVPSFTVAENICLIHRNRRRQFLLHSDEINHEADAVLQNLSIGLAPETLTSTLSSLNMHLVEIAKAIHEGARILILNDVMDEYSPKDSKAMIKLLDTLCRNGIAILMTSRRFEVLSEICNRITIFRGGTNVRTLPRDEFARVTFIKLLVGRPFDVSYRKKETTIAHEVLRLENLSAGKWLRGMSFSLHKGEVFGIIDIDGKTSGELVQTLLGEQKITHGTMWLGGRKTQFKHYRDALGQGIGYVPENWRDTLFENLPVADNLGFLIIRKMSNQFMFVNNRVLKFLERAFAAMHEAQVVPGKKLIGDLPMIGRLQVLIYRWIVRQSQVLILDRPSVQIDLVERKKMYQFLEKEIVQNTAILLIATDLAEAAAICDRAIVITGERAQKQYSRQAILELTSDAIY